MDTSINHFMLSDKTYNFTKKLVQIVLPAVAALYFGLAKIWGLPGAEEVVGTLAVITTFLGVVLGISSSHYASSDSAFDGHMVVSNPENGPKMFSLELDSAPEDIEAKDSIRFKVRSEEPSPGGDVS